MWWVVHLKAAVGTEQKAGKQTRLSAFDMPLSAVDPEGLLDKGHIRARRLFYGD